MALISFKSLFSVPPKTRWSIIICAFLVVMALDFSTPPDYIWAYLYVVPILLSVSFMRPKVSRTLLTIAIAATLLNLFLPYKVVTIPSVLLNRILAALSILVSTFFMLRYIQHQEKLQMQERLLESEQQVAKVREDLIATLTHDLKTPLLGEQAALQHFNDGVFGPVTSEQANVLNALSRSNSRELALVDNLLTVYKQDALGVNTTRLPINLDELIADLLSELQYLANKRKISLNYECRKAPPVIYADALQLKRVLSNLIHNALNYVPSGGHIHIQLLQKDLQAQVSVEDDGPGLSDTDLEQVFHRLYRAGGERQVIGTGLGLYLSRQIIEAHQGRIWAEHCKPTGCRFVFELPINGESHK